jgi:hypothetical protein
MLVLILALVLSKKVSFKIIQWFALVFAVTNITSLFLIFASQPKQLNATDSNLADTKTSIGSSDLGDQIHSDHVLHDYHLCTLLYTCYAVLHMLATNWVFTWWAMLLVLIGASSAMIIYATDFEPLMKQPFYALLVILFFFSSYFSELNTLKQWLHKDMLKKERACF